MYNYKIVVFAFSILTCVCLSTAGKYLEVHLHCNEKVLKEKLPVKNSDDFTPFLKKDFKCASQNDHVKVIIPESNSIATSKLTSNIALYVAMNNGMIIGVNMIESEQIRDSEYVFKEVKIIDMNTISDVDPVTSATSEIETQKTTKTEPSFLRKYWWLIAIGFITYSVLTTDQSLTEHTEINSANGQIHEGKSSRKANKNSL
ncbi:Uncharacterized protein CTYZ_00003337 [Cryptosporidium tyzzeri]|nr:Uncharacterized protein CTYZ_00003337 [Cryptosporidium tyzzeri]